LKKTLIENYWKMDSDSPDEQEQTPLEVLSSGEALPDDPNDDYYLINCFVCQEQAKPGQVKISFKLMLMLLLLFILTTTDFKLVFT
jgi:hypothetical protein